MLVVQVLIIRGKPLNWGEKVGKVAHMNSMFANCTSFNQDISGWDTSNVKDMTNMFSGCVIFNQDISSWDVRSVAWSSAVSGTDGMVAMVRIVHPQSHGGGVLENFYVQIYHLFHKQ